MFVKLNNLRTNIFDWNNLGMKIFWKALITNLYKPTYINFIIYIIDKIFKPPDLFSCLIISIILTLNALNCYLTDVLSGMV